VCYERVMGQFLGENVPDKPNTPNNCELGLVHEAAHNRGKMLDCKRWTSLLSAVKWGLGLHTSGIARIKNVFDVGLDTRQVIASNESSVHETSLQQAYSLTDNGSGQSEWTILTSERCETSDRMTELLKLYLYCGSCICTKHTYYNSWIMCECAYVTHCIHTYYYRSCFIFKKHQIS